MAADYDDEREIGERPGKSHTILGPTSLWGESAWGQFYWGATPIRKAEQRVFGRGRNISVTLFCDPRGVEPFHVLSGVTVLYTMRKMKR